MNRKKSPEVSTQYESDFELTACDKHYMFWEYLEVGELLNSHTAD